MESEAKDSVSGGVRERRERERRRDEMTVVEVILIMILILILHHVCSFTEKHPAWCRLCARKQLVL